MLATSAGKRRSRYLFIFFTLSCTAFFFFNPCRDVVVLKLHYSITHIYLQVVHFVLYVGLLQVTSQHSLRMRALPLWLVATHLYHDATEIQGEFKEREDYLKQKIKQSEEDNNQEFSMLNPFCFSTKEKRDGPAPSRILQLGTAFLAFL